MGLLIGAVNWPALRLVADSPICLSLSFFVSLSLSLCIAHPLSVFNYNWGDLGLRLSTDIRVRVAHRQPIEHLTPNTLKSQVEKRTLNPGLLDSNWDAIDVSCSCRFAARFWLAWPIKDAALGVYAWRGSPCSDRIYRLPYLKLVKLNCEEIKLICKAWEYIFSLESYGKLISMISAWSLTEILCIFKLNIYSLHLFN